MSFSNEWLESVISSSETEGVMQMFWEMYEADEDREETPLEYARNYFEKGIFTSEELDIIEGSL